MDKKTIAGFLPEDLIREFKIFSQPGYRVGQLLCWIYKKHILDFSLMTDLPEDLRFNLNNFMQPVSLSLRKESVSADKTVKYVFETGTGELIESVFIPLQKRATVCVSTQVGCSFGCIFCASGLNGLKRNLSAGEIVSQLVCIQNKHPLNPITNVVFMGMGEPLSNYEQTLKAVRILNNPECAGLGARKITISTCGLPDKILQLSKEKIQIELSISLHSADDALRDKLMPVNKIYPIEQLIMCAKKYTEITQRIITFEYVLISGINAAKHDALKLAKLLAPLRCKVNLIPFNPVQGLDFLPASLSQVNIFKSILENKRINVTVRRQRGVDVQSACGQLVRG